MSEINPNGGVGRSSQAAAKATGPKKARGLSQSLHKFVETPKDDTRTAYKKLYKSHKGKPTERHYEAHNLLAAKPKAVVDSNLKKTTKSLQKAAKATRAVDEFAQGLTSATKSLIHLSTVVSSSAASVGAQTLNLGGALATAGMEALGLGLGLLNAPQTIYEGIEHVGRGVTLQRNRRHAKQYMQAAPSNELQAAAKQMRSRQDTFGAAVKAINDGQRMLSIVISSSASFVGAVSTASGVGAPVGAAATAVAVGAATGSLGISIGLKLCTIGNSIRKKAVRKLWNAAASGKGPYSLRATLIAKRQLKKEGVTAKSPEYAAKLTQAKADVIHHKRLKHDIDYMAEVLYTKLKVEQIDYFNNKKNPELTDSETVQFLRHFGLSDMTIKAIIDSRDNDVAIGLLKSELRDEGRIRKARKGQVV